MLSRIIIKNFALIEKEEIEFGKGLNVLSGETGAGKSIIFGALNFVLGERADKSFLRQNQTSMRVEAVFSDVSTGALDLLDELGIDKEEDSIFLSRTMNAEGKTEARINGSFVTLANLKRVTSLLIDVYGQHEHQSLLKVSSHIDILDNFCDDKLDKLKVDLKEKISVLKEINASLNTNYGDEAQKKYKLELLEYQIDEIKKAGLIEGEEDELSSQKRLMQNSEKIAKELQNIKNIFASGYAGNDISNALKEGEYALKSLKNIDPCFEELGEKLASLRFELIDIEGEIEDKSSFCIYDEDELSKIEERLDLIKSLKRKYGESVEEIQHFLLKAEEEYNNILHNDEIVEKLTKQKRVLLEEIFKITSEITKVRKNIARILESNIISELKDLGMKGANFVVDFEKETTFESLENDLTSNGVDSVEFLFSANVGQPLKQLSKVISGGEMSRFMLAYKKVVSEKDNIHSLLFDEIDNGISGTIGQEVAYKLAHIARKCQVIAISHLPQIVSMADKNFLIEKGVVGGETVSNITPLEIDGTIKEIARLSGANESELALLHAKELREVANKYKTSINE